MPQPVSNTTTVVSGSLLAEKISYVVDGQSRNYRGGYGGLSWMSEAPAANNVIFIGNTTDIGRGPAGKPLFYPSYNTTQANIVYAVNKLPGSPGNFTTSASAYDWAVGNNFFINNSDNPIPRIDADGLVLYLNAFLPTSYPQTGTTWYDLSGYGNNATLYNGLNSNWNSNGWFSFDGVDDYAAINYNASSMAAWTGSQTIIFWEYHTFNDGSRRNFWNQAYGGAGTWTHEGGYYINYFYGNSGVDNIPYTALGSTATPTGRWSMLATTRDPSQVNWYQNNINTANQSNPFGVLALTTNGITIGTGYTGTPWVGNIGAIAAYNKALTQAEINQVYFQSNIVTDGLIFMIDANNLVSYPKSGTTWYNLTGSGAGGTLNNGPTFNSNNGGSIIFDGADDFANFNGIAVTTTSTVSFWVNFISCTGTVDRIYSTSPSDNFEVGVDTNGLISYYPNGSNNWQSTSTSIPKNNWSNLTFTISGGAINVYKDGVLTYTGTSNTTNGTNTFLARRYSGGEFVNCQIANTQIYNRALTPTEVQQNYEATKDKFLGQNIVTNGLLLNLDAANKNSYPGTGTTWSNTVSTSYNATLYNGPIFNPSTNTISLDGVDDYVASSVNSALSNVSTVVMLCYGIPSATDRMYCSFGGYDVYYYGGTNDRRLGFNTGNGDIYGCTGISDSTISGLTMYTFVFRTDVSYTNNQIWINTTQQSLSQLQGTENAGLRTFTIGNFHVGGWVYGGYYPNIGVISTLVYNRQLSSSEITQNYNAFRSKFGF